MGEQRLYPDKKGSDRVLEECGKCSGTGSVWWGAPVSGAVREASGKTRLVPKVCFKCNGVGKRSVLVSSVRARETNAARAERKRQAEQDALQAKRDAFEAEHAEFLAEAAQSETEWVKDWTRTIGVPTEAQIAAAQKQIEREKAEAARKAAAEPVPATDERVKISGEIVGFKEVEQQQGWRYVTALKMIVLDERGFKVYGTLPNSLADDLYNAWYAFQQAEAGESFYRGDYGPDYWKGHARGTKVEFMAKVSRSNDDEKFGFFSRPTKAKIVEAVAA